MRANLWPWDRTLFLILISVLILAPSAWAMRVSAAPPSQTEIENPTVEEQLRAIGAAGGGEFSPVSDVQELNWALKHAADGQGPAPLLLAGAGLTACLVPLGLILIVVLVVRGSRRRRTPAPLSQPAYAPPGEAGAMYAAPQDGPPPQHNPPPRYSAPTPQRTATPSRYTAPPPQYNGPPRYATPAYGTPVPFRAIGAGELVLLSGQANPAGHDLSLPAVRIGRSAQGNHVVVQDPLVSSAHAEIRAQGGGHYVQDLRSTNGTFVNGERISRPYPLADGDRITLGNTEWLYRCGGGTMSME
jgi:hypothetical protein